LKGGDILPGILRSQFAISKRPCDLIDATAGALIVAF